MSPDLMLSHLYREHGREIGNAAPVDQGIELNPSISSTGIGSQPAKPSAGVEPLDVSPPIVRAAKPDVDCEIAFTAHRIRGQGLVILLVVKAYRDWRSDLAH